MTSTVDLSHKPLWSTGSVVLGCTLKHFPNNDISNISNSYIHLTFPSVPCHVSAECYT
jgi:hypothetical protein